MRILQVASEAFGLIKTGGLADVTAGLSSALRDAGDDVRVMLPNYRGCAQLADASPWLELGDPLGSGPARLLRGRLPGTQVPVILLDAPALFDRPGGPYQDTAGQDFVDNPERFALLGRAAAMLCQMGAAVGWQPEVVHAHDWQASLTPAHLSLWGGRRPATITTIHNLRFQGRFDPAVLGRVGLPSSAYAVDGVECYGTVSFLKAGIYYADRVTTVSPTYAEEIRGETAGEGLHGLLGARGEHLHGLLNGIDHAVWDPSTDPALPATFDARDLSPRTANKRALQDTFGLPQDDRTPLLGWVSRLTDQKGVDLLLAALSRVLATGAQVAVLGSGDGALEAALAQAADAHPKQIGFQRGYSESLSRGIFGGADMFLVPSRFEPCGLTQLYALRYGAVPIVRRTGGLADTVPDRSRGGVGFSFDAPQPDALADAIERAIAVFSNRDDWRALQRQGMAVDHGWPVAAARYRRLYREALAAREAASSR